MGLSLYEAQQLVKTQQETIENLEDDIKKHIQEREDLESEVKHLKEEYYFEKAEVERAETKGKLLLLILNII